MTNRENIFRFLNEYSSNIKEQIDINKTVNTLLKSYVFETYINNQSNIQHILTKIMSKLQYNVKIIDEGLFKLSRGEEIIGYVEQIDDRFSVFYSIDKAQRSDNLTTQLVRKFPAIDSLWISGKMFEYFWQQIQYEHEDHRFIKLKFEFDNFFDTPENIDLKNDISVYDDKRLTSASFAQELHGLKDKIDRVKLILPVFNSVGLLRFPARTGKGGHDFYRNGKVTNRSDDFYDHRSQIVETALDYHGITKRLEEMSWLRFDTYSLKSEDVSVKGMPITFNFSIALKLNVFHNFVNYTFANGKEPFKISGTPIWNSEKTMAHVYGIDVHIWQKILLELSQERFVMILPQGSCGNTIHRLITNIQRYLDPAVSVFIGDNSYENFIMNNLSNNNLFYE